MKAKVTIRPKLTGRVIFFQRIMQSGSNACKHLYKRILSAAEFKQYIADFIISTAILTMVFWFILDHFIDTK